MHCGRVSNLLSAYIDRELAGTEMLQIRRHLGTCPGCSAEHEALGRVKSLLGATPRVEPSGDAVAAVVRRWSERREESGATRRPQPIETTPRRVRQRTWMTGPLRWQRYGLVFSTGCLALALVVTALALRKPNYPDALAANIWPSLSQPEETVVLADPAQAWRQQELLWLDPRESPEPWVPRSRVTPWWRDPAPRLGPMLISDSTAPLGWGR